MGRHVALIESVVVPTHSKVALLDVGEDGDGELGGGGDFYEDDFDFYGDGDGAEAFDDFL
jgi:hypothetical protein